MLPVSFEGSQRYDVLVAGEGGRFGTNWVRLDLFYRTIPGINQIRSDFSKFWLGDMTLIRGGAGLGGLCRKQSSVSLVIPLSR